MAFVSGTTGNEAAQKFLEVLQNDFKNLGQETKKKYPQIKEVSSVRSSLRCIDVRNATNIPTTRSNTIDFFFCFFCHTHNHAPVRMFDLIIVRA